MDQASKEWEQLDREEFAKWLKKDGIDLVTLSEKSAARKGWKARKSEIENLQTEIMNYFNQSEELRAQLARRRNGKDAAVAAIKYALHGDEPMTFLRLWFEGNFDSLRAEWDNVPEEVFIGADPLYYPRMRKEPK